MNMNNYFPALWLAYFLGAVTVIAVIIKVFFTSWRGVLAFIGVFILLAVIGAIQERFL